MDVFYIVALHFSDLRSDEKEVVRHCGRSLASELVAMDNLYQGAGIQSDGVDFSYRGISIQSDKESPLVAHFYFERI